MHDTPTINTQKINFSSDRIELFKPYDPNVNDIAYLQYTSGSTGNSKGVMVTHNNILRNLEALERQLNLMNKNQDGNSVMWVPHQHALGLVAFINRSIVSARHTIIISPLDFIAEPSIWLKAISMYKAVFTASPSFGYEHATRSANPTLLSQIDLSSLTVAGNGGMHVSSTVLDEFNDQFKHCGFDQNSFIPTLGMAEHTLFVNGMKTDLTSRVIQQNDLPNFQASDSYVDINMNLVSLGQHDKDKHDLKIIDTATLAELPENTIGEVWLQGPSVAKGYWNDTKNKNKYFKHTQQTVQAPFCELGTSALSTRASFFLLVDRKI